MRRRMVRWLILWVVVFFVWSMFSCIWRLMVVNMWWNLIFWGRIVFVIIIECWWRSWCIRIYSFLWRIRIFGMIFLIG